MSYKIYLFHKDKIKENCIFINLLEPMLTTSDIFTFLKERISPEAQREGQELVNSGTVEITKLTSQMVGGVAQGTRIQVQFSPEKVHITKECSCQTKNCPHIPAILQLWNESSEQAFTNKAGYWRKVISDMPEEDKGAFILEQVKRAKATAYDLRAYILRQQGLYAPGLAKAIFDEIKSPVVRSTKSPTAPQVRIFGQITKTTLKSADHLVQAGYVFQGIAILMYLLESLHYLYFRLLRNNSTVLKHIVQVEDNFTELFPLIRAPEAQYDILESWKNLSSKSYYIPISTEQIGRFYQSLNTLETRQNILDHVESLVKETSGFSKSVWTDIWFQIILFDSKTKSSMTYDLIPDHKIDMLWDTFKTHEVPANFHSIFLDMLHHVSAKNLAYTLPILVREEMIELILETMEKNPSIILPATPPKLASKIYTKCKTNSKITLLQKSSVLAQTQNLKSHLQFIKKENQLQATVLLLPYIPKEEIVKMEDLILGQLNHYLQTHIGSKSEVLIEELIQVLTSKKNHSLLKIVKSTLKDSFGYRNDIHNVLSTQ